MPLLPFGSPGNTLDQSRSTSDTPEIGAPQHPAVPRPRLNRLSHPNDPRSL